MMKKENWIWMPHAGHLCVARNCEFSLNTYIGKYIVSTVGEYMPDSSVREMFAETRNITLKGKGDERLADYMEKIGYEEIGSGRKYETLVFHATRSEHKCCPYTAKKWSEVDSKGYNEAHEACKGHYEMCLKWSNKSK